MLFAYLPNSMQTKTLKRRLFNKSKTSQQVFYNKCQNILNSMQNKKQQEKTATRRLD